jgi:uncharacterized iron-regulated membrane protein
MTSLSNQPTPVPTAPATPEIPPAPGWAALRPLLLRVHFYAGILIAPFLVVLCLTGLAYVFSPQLNDVVYQRELLVGPHTGPARPLDQQIGAALAAHPKAGSARWSCRRTPSGRPVWCWRFRDWART